MESAVIALFVYSVLITAKYLQQRADYQDIKLEANELIKLNKAVVPYMQKLTNECTAWKERCRIAESERDGDRETVRRIRAIFEPSSFASEASDTVSAPLTDKTIEEPTCH